MKPIRETEFKNATPVQLARPHLIRTWTKINGKLECRYEMQAPGK